MSCETAAVECSRTGNGFFNRCRSECSQNQLRDLHEQNNSSCSSGSHTLSLISFQITLHASQHCSVSTSRQSTAQSASTAHTNTSGIPALALAMVYCAEIAASAAPELHMRS